MLKRCCTDEDIRKITDYIGSERKLAPYIYLNSLKYGKGAENVSTWLDLDSKNRLCGVYLLYFDCLHFFTKDNTAYPIEKLLDMIELLSPKVIMVLHELGERLAPYLQAEYSLSHNHIMDMDNVGIDDGTYAGSIAKESDIEQIIHLLMSNEEYTNVYDEDLLRKQLYDRFHESFSRFFIIYSDNKIVATCSTYGEVPGFAIVGGVIVHPEYRRMGYASSIDRFACHTLNKENISKISFVSSTNTASFAMHLGIGAKDIGVMDKYVRLPAHEKI